MNEKWMKELESELVSPYFYSLEAFVGAERQIHDVLPSPEKVFHSLAFTSPEETKVVIIGQDPYHGPGQAHGLSFSVPHGVTIPPSLRNIFKELSEDCGESPRSNGDLTGWADQGVLLLNSTLTVRCNEPGSHIGHGWEEFTDQIIRVMNNQRDRCVFILWGAQARSKKNLITAAQHVVIESAHPSPLSSYRGFFGSRPFTRANQALIDAGRTPIDWNR